MSLWIEAVLVAVVLLNLFMVGSSRLATCIRCVAVQGILFGLITVLVHEGANLLWTVVLATISISVKGLAFPVLLFRALREAEVRREIEPYVGYSLSILVGLTLLLFSLWLSSRLQLPRMPLSPLIVPVALFTNLIGLFVIISRKKALTQILGYLVLENGIYAFGVGLVHNAPLVVELGVLLDVFVAVFVMGITMFHINREFDHIDTDQMALLKD